MGFLTTIGNAIGDKVGPLIELKLDELSKRFEAKLDAWFDKAMATLPAVGAEIAEKAVQTVFDNTQIDEATDEALGVVTGFFDQLRKGFKQLPFGLGGKPLQ